MWDNEEVCETKTSKADLGSVVNMGFGSLLLYSYPDGKNNTHHSSWRGERVENKSHVCVGMHTHQKKKKEEKKTAIEEDRERTIFLLTFYL